MKSCERDKKESVKSCELLPLLTHVKAYCTLLEQKSKQPCYWADIGIIEAINRFSRYSILVFIRGQPKLVSVYIYIYHDDPKSKM